MEPLGYPQHSQCFPTSTISLSLSSIWNLLASHSQSCLSKFYPSFKAYLKYDILGERERWQRNRTARPLSPSQIPQKNISTPSKLHKTTSVGWQRTLGIQKSRSLSSKTGRKKYKRRKGDKGGGEGAPSREGKPVPGREF